MNRGVVTRYAHNAQWTHTIRTQHDLAHEADMFFMEWLAGFEIEGNRKAHTSAYLHPGCPGTGLVRRLRHRLVERFGGRKNPSISAIGSSTCMYARTDFAHKQHGE